MGDITIKNLSLVSPLNIPYIQKCIFTYYPTLKLSYDQLQPPHTSMKCAGMTRAFDSLLMFDHSIFIFLDPPIMLFISIYGEPADFVE